MTDVDPITAELDVSTIPEEMGVYAVYNEDSRLQYIGLSRNMQKSVSNHAESIGPSESGTLISSVRIVEMPGESKELLKATWERWIKEHMDNGGEIPAGNLPGNAAGADPRWRAKAGKTKQPLNLGQMGRIVSMEDALEAVEKAVKKNPVVLFMKGTPIMPQCGFSAKSVGIMREIGVEYDTVNVMDAETNPGVRDAVKEYSKWPTIPQLFINGELVGGCDIITEMHASGQLETALKSAGASADEASKSEGGTGTSEAVPKGEILLIDDPKRPTATSISQVLSKEFDLHSLRIVDDSAAHEGDAGALEMGLTSESHFSIQIAAPEFAGLSPVQRQQKVYAALSDLMPRIHALSLVTKTPTEAVAA
jgi:Grx4 family monothiol glutaredoxin